MIMGDQQRWHSVITGQLQYRTLETVKEVAQRLQNPEYILSILNDNTNTAFSPVTLASGYPSLALTFLYLAKSDFEQQWETAAQNYLQLTAKSTHIYPFPDASIYTGSSGLATVLSLFADDNPRYIQTCQKVNHDLAAEILQKKWRRDRIGLASYDYDAISGVAGIAGYLISIPSTNTVIREAIEYLLTYLVWLCGEDERNGLQRWFIAPDLMPEMYDARYPDGYFNLGLSHGISGPLAALSLAWMAGYRIDGQREAIANVSRWITEHQVQDKWGINWPSGIPLKASFASNDWSRIPPARAAWCYGAPGITRALWLAGKALGNDNLLHQAIEGIKTVLTRPIEELGIYSPTLCHGFSGLLQICLRFANESNDQTICNHLTQLIEQILATFQPESPFGFRDEEKPGVFTNDPGFLNGVSGVILTLLAATTSIAPMWDRTLLIA